MLTLDHLNHRDRRSGSLLSTRRRDSGVSVASGISNLSKYSHLSQGKICITLEVDSLRYLKSSDEYDLKFSDASIISLDIIKKQIRCKIKATKIKQIQEELDDDDLSSMLDDIDYDIDNKTDADSAPNDKTVEQEWIEIAPRKRDKKDRAYGSCSIGDCDCIERITFILKHYAIFIKFKQLPPTNLNESNDGNLYSSMTKFINRLKGYNRVRLLNDYYHVKKYHMNNDTEKELLDYIKTKVPNCNDIDMCQCCTRNEGDKQIYRTLSNKGRRDLYWIDDDIKDGSEEEMHELILIEYLDIIHSFFIHSGLISDGKKFITEIEADRAELLKSMNSTLPPNIAGSASPLSMLNRNNNNNNNHNNNNGASSSVTIPPPPSPNNTDIDGQNGKDSDDSKVSQEEGGGPEDDIETNYDDSTSEMSTNRGCGHGNRAIPELKSSFGQSFDYWKVSHPYYCPAIHSDLRSELLSNNIYSISNDDYNMLSMKALDYLKCDIGKHLQCKREFRWMKKSIKCGDRISLNHIISIILATCYGSIMCHFRNIGCRKLSNNECIDDIKRRHCQISHFLRYLKESIWCFGDILHDKQRIYHGINCKLSFPKCSISFDLPCSLTTKYNVAQKMDNSSTNIVLSLGKVLSAEQNMVYLDVSNFSYYPSERQRIIFGGNLGFIDIIYSGSSHSDSIMSLTLYQQIIAGKWYNNKTNIYFRKKYQRKIIKMINNMINYDNDHNVHNKYMQQLFECCTKTTKIIWINKKECEKLIPELYKILSSQKYIEYLLNNKISIKYAYSLEMNLSVIHINDSSFKKSLYSKKYKFNVSNNGDKVSLHFRCYKKYDAQKEEDMFRGFIATQSKLPKSVSKIELKYGLQFIQLGYDKWDSCTLSNSQLYKGSSLFKMQQIQNCDMLNVKIAFQIKAIYDQNGKLIQL